MRLLYDFMTGPPIQSSHPTSLWFSPALVHMIVEVGTPLLQPRPLHCATITVATIVGHEYGLGTPIGGVRVMSSCWAGAGGGRILPRAHHRRRVGGGGGGHG
jgi:hypothetical protein